MIWEVCIECWYEDGAKRSSIRRYVEVDAADHEDARRQALDHCDSTAHCSKKWTAFEFVKSYSMPSIKYPREQV